MIQFGELAVSAEPELNINLKLTARGMPALWIVLSLILTFGAVIVALAFAPSTGLLQKALSVLTPIFKTGT